MKKLNALFQSVVFVCAVNIAMPLFATITIKYESTAEGAIPAISKVLFSEGLKKDKEIPHVTLAQLVDQKQRAVLEKKDEYFASWKRFTGAQMATFATATAVFIANYINDDTVAAFKRKPFMQSMVQKIQTADAMKCKIAAYAFLAGLGAYPLIRYYKLFGLTEIEFYYPCESIDGKIAVFRKKSYSHSVSYGDVVIHYYNISDPIGYMTLEEKEKEFKILSRVRVRNHVSLLNTVLCAGGLLWAATR